MTDDHELYNVRPPRLVYNRFIGFHRDIVGTSLGCTWVYLVYYGWINRYKVRPPFDS